MRKKHILSISLILLSMFQILNSQSFNVELYPEGKIPNFQATDEVEKRDTTEIVRIGKVQTPDIQVFLPSKRMATGDAVIICPGGGYWILAYDLEGEDIAKFLNSKGIAAIVLKYRLPTSESQIIPHKSPLMDAQRAMRLVRYKAEDWNINPGKIGIMGFSAGGHLASTLSTHFDMGNAEASDPIERVSCRPDFSVLMYPVISFIADYSHTGSCRALLGEDPDPELVKYYSNELQVNENTPPAILILASDDTTVPVDNSISYYKALLKHGVSAEMHLYAYGNHGFGLARKRGYLSSWTDRCSDWILNLNKEDK